MAYKVLITREAKKDVEKLDVVVRRQLYKKLLHYSSLGDIKAVAKKLVNREAGEYRLRIGSYRVIFDLDRHTMILLRVQHRKDAY